MHRNSIRCLRRAIVCSTKFADSGVTRSGDDITRGDAKTFGVCKLNSLSDYICTSYELVQYNSRMSMVYHYSWRKGVTTWLHRARWRQLWWRLCLQVTVSTARNWHLAVCIGLTTLKSSSTNSVCWKCVMKLIRMNLGQDYFRPMPWAFVWCKEVRGNYYN